MYDKISILRHSIALVFSHSLFNLKLLCLTCDIIAYQNKLALDTHPTYHLRKETDLVPSTTTSCNAFE